MFSIHFRLKYNPKLDLKSQIACLIEIAIPTPVNYWFTMQHIDCGVHSIDHLTQRLSTHEFKERKQVLIR